MPKPPEIVVTLICVEQVAALLNVSTRTVWRLLSAGRLPQPLRFGGNVRWRLDQLGEWIERGCPTTTGEP